MSHRTGSQTVTQQEEDAENTIPVSTSVIVHVQLPDLIPPLWLQLLASYAPPCNMLARMATDERFAGKSCDCHTVLGPRVEIIRVE